jgi:hydrogenase maturation factor
LIASGALLVVVAQCTASSLLRAFNRRRIQAAAIGEICRESEGIRLVERGKAQRLRVPERDEIARLL